MAQRKRARKQAKAAQDKRPPRQGSLILGHRNVMLMVAGVIIILIGYLLLGRGSITAAPLLLVIGYCVMVPLAIVLWTRKPEDRQQSKMGE